VAQRVGRGIALLFHDHGTRRGVSGQQHALAALYSPGKTRYPLYRRLGGPQGRSGQVRKISSPPAFDPGPSSPQSVAIVRNVFLPVFCLVTVVITFDCDQEFIYSG
jgi:hypothetical protein